MTNSTKIKAQQTLIDIAVEKCGSPEALFDVAALNGKAITDDLISGEQAFYGDSLVFEVADYFRKYGLSPASAATNPANVLNPGGIGYMAVEFDFIVS